MRVAFLPHAMKGIRRLSDVSLSDLAWPLESNDHGGRVGDLTADDHLVVSPSSRRLYFPPEKLKCSVSLRILEPYSVHRRHYLAMYFLWPRFHRIFTRCKRLTRYVPNARFAVLTPVWLEQPLRETNKTKDISLIASNKRKLRGHRLRHTIASWASTSTANVDLLGRAYQPFERKEDGLAPYRFSIVIENNREPGYFTEKLMDCILCNTIPIYWGAPDIADYFNPKGMIICQNKEEIMNAVWSLSSDDYSRMLPHAAENFERALRWMDHEKLIANYLLDESQSDEIQPAAA